MKTQIPNPKLQRSSKFQNSKIGIAVALLACASLAGGDEIHLAAKWGISEGVQVILDADPKLVGAEDQDGNTPLHWAVKTGDFFAWDFLLVADGDVDYGGNYRAKRKGNETIQQMFEERAAVRKSAAKAIRTPEQTPLIQFRFTDAEKRKVVKILLASGADPNAKNKFFGATPLHVAALTGDLEIVEQLLAHKADINLKDDMGRTALHFAALDNRKDMVGLLLKHKADVNAKDDRGNTPLRIAWDDDRLIDLLREHGAKGPSRSEAQAMVLGAVRRGDTDRLRDLLKSDASLANAMQERDNRWSLLHEAVTEGHLEITSVLLDGKANPNMVNTDGETPLHWAVRKGRVEIAKLLLDAKADPNMVDKNKRTPLHEAAFRGQKEIVELLIAAKADLNAKDAKGKTPLFYALDAEHKDVAEILRKAGGKE